MDARTVFTPFARRWVDTYKKFSVGHPHRIVVVFGIDNHTDDATEEDKAIFEGLPCDFITYRGGGIDCGSAQFASQYITSEFMVGMTSRVYFHREGALRRLVEAFTKHGGGLVGSTGSYEACPVPPRTFPNPHLRTVWYGMSPLKFRKFPYEIKSREDAHHFEAGNWNVTRWFLEHGWPVRAVTWDKTYGVDEFRHPELANGFRRGDQSDCLVWDRHTAIYDAADNAKKRELAIATGDR